MPNMMSFKFLFASWIRFQTINNNFLSEVDNYSFKMTQFSTNNIMLQSCHPYMEHKGEKCISPVMHYPQIIIERREKIRRKWNKFDVLSISTFSSKLIYTLCTISLSFIRRNTQKYLLNMQKFLWTHMHAFYHFFLFINYFLITRTINTNMVCVGNWMISHWDG